MNDLNPTITTSRVGSERYESLFVGDVELRRFVGVSDSEWRTRDLDLGEMLGYERSRNIRHVISELRKAEKHNDFAICCGSQQNQGRGRPATEYWLTEEEAYVVIAEVRTPKAREIKRRIVRIFLAVRRASRLTIEDASRIAKQGEEIAQHGKQLAVQGQQLEEQGHALLLLTKEQHELDTRQDMLEDRVDKLENSSSSSGIEPVEEDEKYVKCVMGALAHPQAPVLAVLESLVEMEEDELNPHIQRAISALQNGQVYAAKEAILHAQNESMDHLPRSVRSEIGLELDKAIELIASGYRWAYRGYSSGSGKVAYLPPRHKPPLALTESITPAPDHFPVRIIFENDDGAQVSGPLFVDPDHPEAKETQEPLALWEWIRAYQARKKRKSRSRIVGSSAWARERTRTETPGPPTEEPLESNYGSAKAVGDRPPASSAAQVAPCAAAVSQRPTGQYPIRCNYKTSQAAEHVLRLMRRDANSTTANIISRLLANARAGLNTKTLNRIWDQLQDAREKSLGNSTARRTTKRVPATGQFPRGSLWARESIRFEILGILVARLKERNIELENPSGDISPSVSLDPKDWDYWRAQAVEYGVWPGLYLAGLLAGESSDDLWKPNAEVEPAS